MNTIYLGNPWSLEHHLSEITDEENDKLIEQMDTDVALISYEYFYDSKIGPKTVILHDIQDTRLLSWTDNPEARKPENW